MATGSQSTGPSDDLDSWAAEYWGGTEVVELVDEEGEEGKEAASASSPPANRCWGRTGGQNLADPTTAAARAVLSGS